MFKRLLLVFILLSLSHSSYAADVNTQTAAAKISYLALFGDLSDYYKGAFAYTLGGHLSLKQNRVGILGAEASAQWIALKSDDTRESSHLRMLTLNAGLDQGLLSLSWYTLAVGLYPELTLWWVSNSLSSTYDKSDKGTLWGLSIGLLNGFPVHSGWAITLPILVHSPRLSIVNFYFDVGLGFAKSF